MISFFIMQHLILTYIVLAQAARLASLVEINMCAIRRPHFESATSLWIGLASLWINAPCVRSNCFTVNRNWITPHCPLPSPSLSHSIFSCIIGRSILKPVRNTLGLCKMKKSYSSSMVCLRFVLVMRYYQYSITNTALASTAQRHRCSSFFYFFIVIILAFQRPVLQLFAFLLFARSPG